MKRVRHFPFFLFDEKIFLLFNYMYILRTIAYRISTTTKLYMCTNALDQTYIHINKLETGLSFW